MDWQTQTAAALVALTLLVFLIRLARPKRKSSRGCGSHCACPKHKP